MRHLNLLPAMQAVPAAPSRGSCIVVESQSTAFAVVWRDIQLCNSPLGKPGVDSPVYPSDDVHQRAIGLDADLSGHLLAWCLAVLHLQLNAEGGSRLAKPVAIMLSR